MTHTPTSQAHPAYRPLLRAAGIDFSIVAFATVTALLTFFTGNGEPRWRNLLFAPLVMVFAVITLRLVLTEIRVLLPAVPVSAHRGRGVVELLIAISAAVIVGPMLLLMPFVFLGALA